ncbi:MAG: IPT/TIG domain-containing protein [Methanoregula sp.]
MKTNRNQKTWIPVIILILSGMLLIGGVSASEFGPWSTQTVDSNGKVGQYSSVALDAAGNPAISYYDQTYGDLKYASWDGSKWIFSTIDCSRSEPKNKWHFWDWGHDRTQDREYITCFHGTEKVGKYSSLAFDNTGKPRISYYDESRGDLKYAAWDGSKWVVTTVDNSGKVGEFSSLAFDSTGKPRISYYDESKGNLKYASWDGSRWIITTVDGSKDERGHIWNNWDCDRDRVDDRSKKVGEYSSLALDSTGKPRISYYDETNKNLMYAAWDGNRWNITTVDGLKNGEGQKRNHWDSDYGRYDDRSNKVGKYSSLALDSTGKPRISYYDESNKNLKYATWDGSKWILSTVDNSKRVGEYVSLKLDANGDPRISYYDAQNHDLKFAAWDRLTSKWVTETVDSTKKVGAYSSLALDSLGNPRISYYDESNRDLKYTAGTGHSTSPTAPTVTGISPTSGPDIGGTVVTVSGTGFTGATGVKFGTTAGTSLTVNSATQITITSPAGAAGTVNVTVTTPAGTSATSPADEFTYTKTTSAPIVTGISPTSGPLAGGTVVTVTGTGFTGATAVTFGTTAGTSLNVNSATQITITSPAGAAGTVNVTVTTPAGTSATSPADEFTYIIPMPTVTGISPTSGPEAGGTVVTVTGTGFTGATAVTFGTTLGTSLTVNSATQITITSPAGTAGTVNVTVTTPGGTSATSPADEFTYTITPLTVTGITPATGIAGISVSITNLTGTGFLPGATVNLTKTGSSTIIATSVVVVSPTQITCTLPLPTPSATSAGLWNVVVTNANGQSVTLTNAFTVTNPAPTVTGINPATGVAGTQLSGVSITGQNFVTDTTPSVWLAKTGEDNIMATDVVVVSPTQITCNLLLTPYRNTLPGQWDLFVKNADGQSGSKITAFALTNPAPVVTSIEPSTGMNGTTIQIVKVVGDNFGFGENPDIWLEKTGQSNIVASDVHIFGTTELKFTLIIPESAPAGKWNLMVRSKDGQVSANLGVFDITPKVGATPLTWDWSVNGWDGWQTATTCPTAGTCSIYGPVTVDGHGEYGSDITSATGSKTESTVWKTFTAPSDTTWTSLTFTGLLSSSDLLNGRKMTINVDGVDVYSSTAGQDPTINGQQFTITRTFTQRNTVKVTISGIQSPIRQTTSYRMQFNTLTLS